MAYCPLCDKKFKDRKGLQGHFRFKHKTELKTGRPATETALTKAIGKQIERERSGQVLMRELERAKEDMEKGTVMRGFGGKEEYGEEKRKGVVFRNR